MPSPVVAAWFLGMSDGRVLFAVNSTAADIPGVSHYVETWFRLNALVRVRPFGVLLTAEAVQNGHAAANYAHAPI